MDAKGIAGELTASPIDLPKQYRRAWKIFIALFLLYVPVVFCVAVTLFKLFKTFVPCFVFAGIWMAAWVASGIRVIVLRYRLKRATQL
jgi:hypothetical protein